jgi:hypothetical protein
MTEATGRVDTVVVNRPGRWLLSAVMWGCGAASCGTLALSLALLALPWDGWPQRGSAVGLLAGGLGVVVTMLLVTARNALGPDALPPCIGDESP